MERKDITSDFLNHEHQNGKVNETDNKEKDTADAEKKNLKVAMNETPEIKFPPPNIWPEKNMKPKKKSSKLKLCSILNIPLICSICSKVSLIFLGYFMSTMDGISIILPIVITFLIWYENKTKKSKNKIRAKAKASSSTRNQLLEKLEELPSWVIFPDKERAEWINDIVFQLWPNINSYLTKFLRVKLETKIRKKYDTFKFEEIDFGNTPPKIDGVKVYNRASTKDSIIIDFDVFYDGDCEINFSMSGHPIGTLRDFQMSVEVRVVLKPLMLKAPIVGGVQVFFLNTPDIDFELEGLSGIPGLSYVLRKQLEDKIRKKIVFPNKITKRFIKTVQAMELKSLEPEGVLRIHIVEGKDLERRDVTGKSDPYGVFTVGAQEYKTSVIKRSLNPKWDEWCEFVILDPRAQQVKFKLYDHDDLNEDDFLGSGLMDIKNVCDGSNDQWISLEGVKHGKIHLRFTWMTLTSDYSYLDKAMHETKLLKVDVSAALITVYIDSVRNLSTMKSLKKPDVYLIMQVGNGQPQKSKIKKHTTDPIFEEGFSFLVKNPEEDVFHINIMDKKNNLKMGYFEYEIKNLINEENREISMKQFPLRSGGPESVITVSIQLRVLTSSSFSDGDSSSESLSDYDLVRDDSTKSHVLAHDVPVPETPLEIEPPILEFNVSKTTSSPIRSPRFKRQNLSINKSVSVDSHHSHHSSEGESYLGKIHIGLQYSERRQKLGVTVLSMSNLPVKDPKDIPDPYVKLKLFSSTNTIRNKTRTVMDNPDPDYNETFEYLLAPSELPEQKLLLTVKTKKKLFANNMMGQVLIDFREVDINGHHNKWYNLGPVKLAE